MGDLYTVVVGQPREEGNRCIKFCVLLWMLQNTPHEVYVVHIIDCGSSLYLFEDLCMVPILQNKTRAIASFIGRLTL